MEQQDRWVLVCSVIIIFMLLGTYLIAREPVILGSVSYLLGSLVLYGFVRCFFND